MEGARRDPTSSHDHRGRTADDPTKIPKSGWRDIALRVKKEISDDNVSIIAGGTAFFALLALIPALAALISIYGLIANPSDIQAQFNSVSSVIPGEVRTLLEQQMTRIASEDKAAGVAAVVGIALALWGAATGMKTVMNALNIIYDEEEKRGYVKLTLTALGLTLFFVLLGLLSIALIVVLPPILEHIGLGQIAKTTVFLVRFPVLLAVALFGLAILYRYGPSRERPRWRWVSPGALVATLLWGVGSILFAVYAQNFGSYNKTYGSLGAVVVLMLWLYISAFVLLLGAEINAETEHQTARDTTTGRPESMGRRGARMADTIGEEQ